MRSLKNRVILDEQLLERATQTWSIDSSGEEASSLDSTLSHMQDRFFARSVWLQLTPQEQRCLFQVLDAAKNGLPYQRLFKKMKLPQEELETVLTRLKYHWVLIDEGEKPAPPKSDTPTVRTFFPYRECTEALFYTGRELFVSYADRSLMALDHLIDMAAWSTIEQLARLCHITIPTAIPLYSGGSIPSISHPSEIRKRLSEAIKQRLAAFELLLDLQPPAQQLFYWLCERREGKATIQEAKAYLSCDDRCFFEQIQALEQHALAFDTLTQDGQRLLFIPHDLLDAIVQDVSQYMGDEKTYAFLPLATPPPFIRDAQPLLCYDLATIIGYVYQNTVERTKDDKLPKQKKAKIRPFLQGMTQIKETQEDVYVDELFYLARHLELLVCSAPSPGEKPCYQPGPRLSAWSQADFVEHTRRFIAWWSQSAHWYDLYPDGKLIYPSTYATNAARKTLLHHLKRCIPERFYRLDALLFAIWKQQPLQIRDFYGHRLKEIPSLRLQREKWMQSGEGQLYASILFSTLHEAGLVTLGYAQTPLTETDDALPESFQLTQFGAAVLAADTLHSSDGASEAINPTDQHVLIVQPSFEILLLQPDVKALYQLIQWAEVKHIGLVSTFDLTRSALLHGLESGNQVKAVLKLLTQHSQKPLPQNVEYTLKDWAKHYKATNLAEVLLIELTEGCQEEDLYRALKTKPVEIRKLTTTLFALSLEDASFGEIRQMLKKAGIAVQGQPVRTIRRFS